ncbi:MAG: hypothetical protein OEM97_00475 [Acidimicrobiia bacterium]|nr:hypothetical protein [Acidimicrobiia bacterium]
MSDPFEEALEAFDLDKARLLIDHAPPEARVSMEQRLQAVQATARREARSLASEIQRLARDNDFAQLLKIKGDPRTIPLINMLPAELVRGSEVQLEGAQKWLDQRVASSRRHFRRAQEAIAGYDTARGEAELLKVDVQFLTGEEQTDLANLREQLDAAELERLELEVRTSDVLAEHQQAVKDSRRHTLFVWAGVITVALLIWLLIGR